MIIVRLKETCMNSKYRPVCLLTILFAIFLAGCAAEAFKIAQEENTIAAYEHFLREYGDSEFVPQATKSIENIKFLKFISESLLLAIPASRDLFIQNCNYCNCVWLPVQLCILLLWAQRFLPAAYRGGCGECKNATLQVRGSPL